MGYLLQLDSSADTVSSVSRALTAEFAAVWADSVPGRRIRRRDLHARPLPHLPTNALHFAAGQSPEGAVVPSAAAVALQQELIGELTDAAAVVIGAPMYNFAMPSTLKAWVDHVHVLGGTASADRTLQPLLGKPVVVVSPRVTPGGRDQRSDFILGPLQVILGESMGMDVTGFVVHTGAAKPPDDFHRPVDDVREELVAWAAGLA